MYEQLEEVFYSRRGHIIPKREQQLVDATGGSATYGEVLPEGIVQLVRNIPMGPDDVFVDLGSGLGRLTIQMACTSAAHKCIGIELSASRHEQAEFVAEQVLAANMATRGSLELRRDDILACDLSEGSHFFLCSTAFSSSACRSLAHTLARSPRFKVLVTSRALPFQTALQRVGEFRCAFCWNAAGTAYVYCKPFDAAPPEVLARFWGSSAAGASWLPTVMALPVATPDL